MIGIVLVTQSGISQHLVQASQRTIGIEPNLLAVDLKPDLPLEQLEKEIAGSIEKNLEPPLEGILILTDHFGSTPTNACLAEFSDLKAPVEILTGVNLPMLLSAVTNRNKLDLKALSEKVLQDGKKSIQNARGIRG